MDGSIIQPFLLKNSAKSICRYSLLDDCMLAWKLQAHSRQIWYVQVSQFKFIEMSQNSVFLEKNVDAIRRPVMFQFLRQILLCRNEHEYAVVQSTSMKWKEYKHAVSRWQKIHLNSRRPVSINPWAELFTFLYYKVWENKYRDSLSWAWQMYF